ncbi:MAG: hypothetical protein QXK67_00900 [Pyrobaculum sp.]
MEKKNDYRQLNIKIYKDKYRQNIKHIKIQNIKYKISKIISLPKDKVNIYIERLITKKTEIINIIEVNGSRIRINKQIVDSGWLIFPRFKLAVGAIFLGDRGVIAPAHVPSRRAYFVPLNTPKTYLLGYVVKDFY